ncbi:bacillithiol biosynthesis cysteine-adding enzyme BshC [Paenibacillus sp. UNCCL117]|uniref:bacillithiol biosynthesis cysteine-adding enzyme BshC n=1 Tax=unclassified Paenibacillus TaxID=185978 RepID=UPI00088043C3|nr:MULTISPECIES: bacillithiol biosynthesis cysteine-adding enzyme BshC [unclassified Paenibacillus]SDC73756.1 bacillithiol biosynthesis cysteine-adding enzyme BshC [Paenibacillus sp. cl123]SFW25080.1 bacillithiol biosynthesis cysteine-adding enzyme BshC [Paenibacillus sp. UNCCL117]
MLQIDAIDWHSGQPLTDDYIRRYALTGDLFDYNPWDASSWEERAVWLDKERSFGADRDKLADVLHAFNMRAGGVPQALQAVDKLRDPRTLCIVGGQQASLFGGPLLVLYKAISLIQAARAAERQLDRPVIPVFWIAGEDHDFDEANHVLVLTPESKVEKIKLAHPGGPRTSVSRTMIAEEQWEEVLAQLEQSLLPTEYKDEVVARLREAVRSSLSLVDTFAKLLASLLGREGLVLLDSDDPALRELEGPMFRVLLERSGELNEAIAEGSAQVRKQGYEPQVEIYPNGANLFVYDETGERVLLYEDEARTGYTDRRGERRFSREELLAWTDEEPGRLSNNVMTRPLMQDYLFPVLATVLGPAEIVYWGQTKQAFHKLGMRMPIVLPRLVFTLLEGPVQKHMQKLGLTLSDVQERLQEKQESWLRERDQLQVERRFAEVAQRFRTDYEPLVAMLGQINPGLQTLGATNLGKIIEQIDFLRQKAEDGLRTQNEAGLRQFTRIGQSIAPGGKPQERVLNMAPYFNKYGDFWLQELVNTEIPLDGKHRICYM